MIQCRPVSACTPPGSWSRTAACAVEDETTSYTGWRNVAKERPSVGGQGNELRRCFERTRAAFPPTGVYGTNCNSGRHSDIWLYGGYWHISHCTECSSNDTYHCWTILTTFAARDGSRTGRPTGCSRWETICRYFGQRQLSGREPKESNNFVRMGHGVGRGSAVQVWVLDDMVWEVRLCKCEC